MHMKTQILFSSLLIVLCFSFVAPAGNSGTSNSKFTVYLGCTYSQESAINAATFKQLITKPLCAKDSANNIYKVKSFEITYAERGLYQDDAGLPIIFTDYSGDNFTGDSITKYWIRNFNEHIYKGDTVYFDRVVCVSSDNKNFLCAPMKIVIR